MRVFLFCFGKLKTPGLRDTADYYQRLLKPWAKLEEVELKPIPVPDKSPATRVQIQEKEARILEDAMTRRCSWSEIFLLDEKAKTLSTLQWAEFVKKQEASGTPTLGFCIGSSLGFSETVRKQARGSLSLGPQTLSHELVRVVFLEQVYRVFSYLNHHPYHNEGS